MVRHPARFAAIAVLLSSSSMPAAAAAFPQQHQGGLASLPVPEQETASRAPVPPRNTPGTQHDSLPSPSPRVLDMLRRTHRSSDWLFITTRSDRYRLRVFRIDSLGLTGFRAVKGPAPFDALAWKDVMKIERRDSRFRSWQLTGAFVGAVGGLLLGRSLTNTGASDGAQIVGLAAGTVLGGVVGGELGDREVRITPLYEAEHMPIEPAEPVPGPAAPTPLVEAGADVDLEHVRASVRPRHLLRVRGTFGWAAGRIDSMSVSGLHGMRPEPRHDPGLGPVPDPIPWSAITSIERRGNSAGTGAVIGGVTLTLVGGALIGALASSSNESGVGPAIAGAILLSGATGAALGSLIGALIPKWHSVMKRRTSPQP